MIRIDTDSYRILGQKYGLPSNKCGMSDVQDYYSVLVDVYVTMQFHVCLIVRVHGSASPCFIHYICSDFVLSYIFMCVLHSCSH